MDNPVAKMSQAVSPDKSSGKSYGTNLPDRIAPRLKLLQEIFQITCKTEILIDAPEEIY